MSRATHATKSTAKQPGAGMNKAPSAELASAMGGKQNSPSTKAGTTRDRLLETLTGGKGVTSPNNMGMLKTRDKLANQLRGDAGGAGGGGGGFQMPDINSIINGKIQGELKSRTEG